MLAIKLSSPFYCSWRPCVKQIQRANILSIVAWLILPPNLWHFIVHGMVQYQRSYSM